MTVTKKRIYWTETYTTPLHCFVELHGADFPGQSNEDYHLNLPVLWSDLTLTPDLLSGKYVARPQSKFPWGRLQEKKIRGATAPKSQDRLKWLLPDGSTGGLVISKALIPQP